MGDLGLPEDRVQTLVALDFESELSVGAPDTRVTPPPVFQQVVTSVWAPPAAGTSAVTLGTAEDAVEFWSSHATSAPGLH